MLITRCFTSDQRAMLAAWNESLPLGLRTETYRLDVEDEGVVEVADVWDRCGDAVYSIEPAEADVAHEAVWLDGCGPRKWMSSVAAAMATILDYERAHLTGRRGLLRAGAVL